MVLREKGIKLIINKNSQLKRYKCLRTLSN